jgi:hypothetical protein
MNSDEIEGIHHENKDIDIDLFPFGKPIAEEDEPIDNSCYNGSNSRIKVEAIPLKYEDALAEKDKKRMERRYFKAFNLIYICLGALIFLVVFDYIVFAITRVNDNNINTVIEIFKALLFSLSGYLFAERQHNK